MVHIEVTADNIRQVEAMAGNKLVKAEVGNIELAVVTVDSIQQVVVLVNSKQADN